ncbi:MAG TPA: SpvB/TcaC N-terminal domain-containing protein, partial [Kofleriaceae bacterium]
MSSERRPTAGRAQPEGRSPTTAGSAQEPVARGHGAATSEQTGAGARAQSLLPSITLPRGGGAIRGIGEKFSTNPATGTASLSIPIATSPGRAGFELGLALTYDSGAGNGPFGLGWHLSTPSITRKTDKGLPRYLDDVESDVFVLSGAEDLVPERLGDGDLPPFGRGDHSVQRYRPRVEGLFARIERWTNRATGDAHWRAITRDNVLNIYGRTPAARIADPAHPERVFSWLLEETRDDRGNIARYTYKPEDDRNVDPARASESNRFETQGGTRVFHATAQRYLERIQYGNRQPVMDRESPAPDGSDDYLFEVVFDHGEYAGPAADRPELAPDPGVPGDWPTRQDPFSAFRSGFEVRTYRLCRRVLMFHRFPGEASLGITPCLVRSTDLAYDEGPVVTYLRSVTQAGYVWDQATGEYRRAALPPLELGYVKPEVHDELRSIDRASLEGISSGIEGSGGQWADLDGEGISGVLLPSERAWYYKPNLGEGQLAPPELQRQLPSPAELGGGMQQLSDLGGDGNLDLVRYAPPLSGYFERTPEGTWASHVALHQVPNLDWSDPNLRFLDVDGDGLPDILISEHDAFVWYRSRGKEGFEPAALAAKPKNEQQGAAIVFADGTETIQLADMSGDGLVDIVRVRNGEVCYWPNLGHGRFGRKVTLDGGPRFDAPDRFDPRRVRLADIDGSGTSDILYLGRDGARLYFNQSGNGLAEARRLASLPPIDAASTVSVVDLLGHGTACLVWSSALPAHRAQPVVYVDLMGGKKPHLLASVTNNFGAETRIAYAPSTRFYLDDKQAGRPWLTRLAFPVHVIERIERVDHVAKSRLVTRFAYHHGYFDGHEREFRGFARVEQWDTETFSGDKGKGLFPELPYDVDPADPDLNLPPVRTVTWFHTGAWLERERLERALAAEYYGQDPQAPLLPDTTLPPGLSIREQREAARALRGQILRQEIYAEDPVPEAAHPYTVSERSYEVRRIQAADGASHGVFFVHPSQTITLHYERRPADPRMQQEVVLAVDDFGQVTQSAVLAYPRRLPERQREEATTGRRLDEQSRMWATLTERGFADRPAEADWYRASVPTWTRTSELTGLPAPAQGPLAPEALRGAISGATEIPFHDEPTGTGVEKRLIDCEERFYYGGHATVADYRSDALGLPIGEITERALVHHVERFAFTEPFLARSYAGAVDAALLASAGYTQKDNTWWVPSGRAAYDPARFFLPVEAVDPFGQWTAVEYDVHCVLAVASKEPRVAGDALSGQVDTADQRFGSVTRSEQDYRVLAPSAIADSNRNRTRVVFNALGLPEEI